MANIATYKIQFKSDFVLTIHGDAGWTTPFCIKFWTGAPSQAYFVGWDGKEYINCKVDDTDASKLIVLFDDHHLPVGQLKMQMAWHTTISDFPKARFDEVMNQMDVVTTVEGEEKHVELAFEGKADPEVEYFLPAYANEAQRIANEEQRIAHEAIRIVNEESRIAAETIRQQNEAQRIAQETARVKEFATLKSQSQAATRDANDAAQLANEKAALAQQKAEYAQQQGDYAKAQGDTAQADHERAEADHGIAVDDHTQAGSDHTRAEADHGIAVDDHTQAGNDHTSAESDHGIAADDHTRAESDHGIAVDDHTQAGNDHTRAESDHGIAADDHTQAGNDHTRAESDHGIAADDHTQAGNDHTRAESDHTRAESDHAAVEVYVDSLGAFDISAYHATGGVLAKYADLTAALGTNGANIPDDLRKGGMSVKFVQSSDNKYVQYRYTGTDVTGSPNPFLDTDNWQSEILDDIPTDGSNNPVKSGGVAAKIGIGNGKFPNDVISTAELESYIFAFLTENQKIFDALDDEGKRHIFTDLIIRELYQVGKMSNPEMFLAEIDKNNNMHHYVDYQGIHHFPAGIVTPTLSKYKELGDVKIQLPKVINIVQGQNISLYTESVLQNVWAKDYNTNKTNVEEINLVQHSKTPSSHDQAIIIYDEFEKKLAEQNIHINILPTSISGNLKVCILGDSKTENTTSMCEVLNLCEKNGNLSVQFIGTKQAYVEGKDSDGNSRNPKHEATSGSSIESLCKTNISAFYDSTMSGDIKFNLTKGFTEIGDVPDILWLNYGANQGVYSSVSVYYDYIINAVKAYNTANNTNIKVVISIQEQFATRSRLPYAFNSPYNMGITKRSFDVSLQDYINAFENRENEGIYICPQYINVDLYNDFPLFKAKVSPRCNFMKDFCADTVHMGVNSGNYNASTTYTYGDIIASGWEDRNNLYCCVGASVQGIEPNDDKINWSKCINVNAGYYKIADVMFSTLMYIRNIINNE